MPSSTFLAAYFSFMARSPATTALALSRDAFFALLGVDRLEHFCYNFDLGFRHNRENIAVEMHRAALIFGVREHLVHGLQHPHALVADDETYGYRPPCKGRFRQSSMWT